MTAMRNRKMTKRFWRFDAAIGIALTTRRMDCVIMTARRGRIPYCLEQALAVVTIGPAPMITTARCIPI